MLQLRDSVEGGAGAALLVPGEADVPLPSPAAGSLPPRRTLRPVSVCNPTRGGRLREYFVFRVRGAARGRRGRRGAGAGRRGAERNAVPPFPPARHHRAGRQ